MAKKSTESRKMKTITSISFNTNRKHGGIADGELICLANEFANLPEHEGIPPTSIIRNFLIKKFREAIDIAKRNRLAAG